MHRYIVRRALQSLLALWVMTLVVFSLARLSGNALDVMLPMEATQEDYERLARYWGLDQYDLLTRAVNPQERERIARAIGDHLFEEFADIPLFGFANEVMANPKVVGSWVYPGLGAGRSTHFHLVRPPAK